MALYKFMLPVLKRTIREKYNALFAERPTRRIDFSPQPRALSCSRVSHRHRKFY
jgi:hypothetical protein